MKKRSNLGAADQNQALPKTTVDNSSANAPPQPTDEARIGQLIRAPELLLLEGPSGSTPPPPLVSSQPIDGGDDVSGDADDMKISWTGEDGSPLFFSSAAEDIDLNSMRDVYQHLGRLIEVFFHDLLHSFYYFVSQHQAPILA